MQRFLLALSVVMLAMLIGGGVSADARGRKPPRGAAPGVAGQVASIDGTTISVMTPKDTVKVATTSATTFEVNGAAGSLSAITVGLYVRAEGSKASDGTFTATRVVASSSAPTPPTKGNAHIEGTVASVDGATISVTTRKDTAKIVTTSTTTFTVNGAAGSLSAITVGLFVRAEGTKASDGTFTATSVVATTASAPTPPVKGTHVEGQVASIDGATITVTARKDTAKIVTTSATTFTVNGAAGSLSAITVGLFVRAEGTTATDGTFTATSVVASSSQHPPASLSNRPLLEHNPT